MLRGNLTPGGTFHLDTAEMPMAVQGLPDASKQSASLKSRTKKKKKKATLETTRMILERGDNLDKCSHNISERSERPVQKICSLIKNLEKKKF